MNNHKCSNPNCQAITPTFYGDKRTKNGLRSWCKECCSLSSKKYNKIYSKTRAAKRTEYKKQFYSILENIEARKKQQRERYQTNDAFRAKHKQYSREYHLKQKYGLTIQDWNTLLLLQDNSCAICEAQFILNNAKHKLFPRVDHCHKTGKVRGLLCNSCNTVLGFFKENIKVLINAQLYITRNL